MTISMSTILIQFGAVFPPNTCINKAILRVAINFESVPQLAVSIVLCFTYMQEKVSETRDQSPFSVIPILFSSTIL